MVNIGKIRRRKESVLTRELNKTVELLALKALVNLFIKVYVEASGGGGSGVSWTLSGYELAKLTHFRPPNVTNNVPLDLLAMT